MNHIHPHRSTVLLTLVLTALAVLCACGSGPLPHRSQASTPTYLVTLAAQSPVVGTTSADVEVHTLDGRPFVPEAVRLVPVMADMGHSAQPVPAQATDRPGRYTVPDAPLFFMTGMWDVDVDVTGTTGTETARFRVLVS